MSGERIVLVGAARYGTLEEKHVALSDLPGPVAGRFGVMNKIEAYLMGSNSINKKELVRRTPFFSKDQREHIIEEVKAAWALRQPYLVEGYRVDSFVREGKRNVTLQYSFRNLRTGRFERPQQQNENPYA